MKISNKKNVIHIALLIILSCLFSASLLLRIYFPNEYFEEVFFYAFHGRGKMDFMIVIKSVLFCLPYAITLFILLFLLTHNILGKKTLSIGNKKIYPFNFIIRNRKIFTWIISIIVVLVSLYNAKIIEYIYYNCLNSNLFEEKYIPLKKEDISISSKKNLIMIFVESLETTLFSKEHGGDWEYEVIPELYKLLNEKEAISFSSNDLYTGEDNLFGTTYTSASIISNTSGVYFRMPLRYNKFSEKHMLNSLYTLGDVLRDNDYIEEVISSGDTSYGCIDYYFKNHGNPTILDPSSLSDFGYKPKKENLGGWGINDKYMYEIAKERISKLATSGKPFYETLISIDTHHVDGFKGNYTINEFDTQYENAYRTESVLLYDFINWLKSQPFYDNTVIVVTGDHTAMQGSLIKGKNEKLRKRYNLILNSSIKIANNKNRTFTSIDMFPTIISAMGGSIKNDQIGLGVNLFANKKTLSEELGLDYINNEFKKNSKFYNKSIIDKD